MTKTVSEKPILTTLTKQADGPPGRMSAWGPDAPDTLTGAPRPGAGPGQDPRRLPWPGCRPRPNTTRQKDGDPVIATPKRPTLNRARAIHDLRCECTGHTRQKERGR